MFQSRNRETSDFNLGKILGVERSDRGFQSRNRETSDFNFVLLFFGGVLLYRFQSRNRETSDFNLRDIDIPVASYESDRFNLVIEKLLISTVN